MAKTKTFVIQEEQNKFHDNLLEIWGREFKFDHEKGISELVKNSADAYIRKGMPDNKQYVVLRFTDEEDGQATVENIDFVGMTSLDIQEAFQWRSNNLSKAIPRDPLIRIVALLMFE